MTGSSAPYLSIVVPARNEAHRLPRTIERLEDALRKLSVSYEIIVVDDGSTDRTASAVDGMKTRILRHSHSRGIAASMRTGSSAASGEFIMTCPADVEDFDFLEGALTASKTFDIISVSKRHPQSVVIGYGRWRWFLSNSYHVICKTLFSVPPTLTDTHYIKFYRGSMLLRAIPNSTIDGPVGETELIINILNQGAAWTEIPARIVHNGNHSKTSFRLVVRSTMELASLFYRQHLSKKARRS